MQMSTEAVLIRLRVLRYIDIDKLDTKAEQ